VKRTFNNYLKSISIFEQHLSFLNNIFSKKIKKKFYAFFLMHLVSWQKKDSIDSNLLNMFNKKKNIELKKNNLIHVFFLFKFIIFFFLIIIFKVISVFSIKKLKKKDFLINFPRVNDTFYERDINLSNKIKNGIIFEFIYSFKDVFLKKKNFIIFIKYITLKDLVYKFCESILIFSKFQFIKKKINKKIIYLLNTNDYNLFNIFLKLIQIQILMNCVRDHKIKNIISNALPTSIDSKIFNYVSNKLNIKYCCFITKLICKNNLGYNFKKNRELYPNFYFINSNQNEKILKFNNYIKDNYFLFRNSNKKILPNSIKVNDGVTILFIFTRNSNENEKLINILDFIVKKNKNFNLYYKYHPQSSFDIKRKNYLEKNAINISNLSNNEIKKIFMKNFNRKIVVTSFSSYVYKILNLGFIPIWLKGFGDIDYLFKDITKNLGFEIYINKKWVLVERNILKLLKNKKSKLIKRDFYSSDYLKFKDFNNFLKNFNKIYHG
jgi:hypothetical protein